ncbi:MAG: hypothetical protein RLZZ158_1912 [Cyanobacteriota bacterium]
MSPWVLALWSLARQPAQALGIAVGPLPSPALPVLVIASGNPHKVAELVAMLQPVELDLRPQPRGLEIEETGSTYAANARLKAETVAALTGQWALADDSGLEVDGLGGRPGIFSARYGPTDHERIHRLLHELGDSLYRGGQFVSAMALADPSGTTVLEAQGICRGLILREPQGQGPGYDPIFYVREAGASYAEMGEHLRRRLGSRGKAAAALAPGLLTLMGLGRSGHTKID